MKTLRTAEVQERSTKGLICVTLEIHQWSGRKRLKKEQLIAKNPEFKNLPPASLATLGSIKICDTNDLAPFNKLKRAAEKVLAENGLPLLGSTGIPEARLENVFRELALIKAKFDDLRDKFYMSFEDDIEVWRNQQENANWAHLILDIPTPEKVAGKLSFNFHLCRVSAPSSDEFSEANKAYANQMTGLKGELFADAAAEAEALITKYLMSKDADGVVRKREQITWKTLRPLKRVSEKFKSFAFLDPSCDPMADMIDHVLSLLPDAGPIEGVHLMHIWTLAQALLNPKRAIDLAEMAFHAESSADAFENLLLGNVKAEPVSAPADAVAAGAEADTDTDGLEAGFLEEPVFVQASVDVDVHANVAEPVVAVSPDAAAVGTAQTPQPVESTTVEFVSAVSEAIPVAASEAQAPAVEAQPAVALTAAVESGPSYVVDFF